MALENVDAKTIKEFLDKILNNKPEIRPWLIIKMGPIAAGKSTVVNQVYEDVLHLAIKDVVEISLDEFVTKLTNFNEQIRDLWASTTIDRQSKAEQLYFSARAKIEEIQTSALLQAMLDHKHVSIETTGENSSWFEETLPKYRSHGYRIAIIYPYVVPEILKKRLQERNETQLRKVEWSRVEHAAKQSQKTFVNLIPFADRALLVDNSDERVPVLNEKPLQVIFDVVKNQVECELPTSCKFVTGMEESLRNHISDKCTECLLKYH